MTTTEETCRKMIAETQKRVDCMLAETAKRCEAMLARAHEGQRRRTRTIDLGGSIRFECDDDEGDN